MVAFYVFRTLEWSCMGKNIVKTKNLGGNVLIKKKKTLLVYKIKK